jgi:leucyl-tRNA synthetase
LTTGEPVEIGSIEKMSKSKKNVVDPDDIIATYGADTARWFMLSDSPPERDVIWTEAGVEGASRFVQRVWRLVSACTSPFVLGDSGLRGEDAMGDAISIPAWLRLRQALDFLVVMIAPMMPHLAEECWATMGGKGFVAEQSWPAFDPALTVDNEITYPIQINGKKRGDLTIARDADQVTVERRRLRWTSSRRRWTESRRAR